MPEKKLSIIKDEKLVVKDGEVVRGNYQFFNFRILSILSLTLQTLIDILLPNNNREHSE